MSLLHCLLQEDLVELLTCRIVNLLEGFCDRTGVGGRFHKLTARGTLRSKRNVLGLGEACVQPSALHEVERSI